MTSLSDKAYRLEELMPHIRSSLAEGKCVTIGPKGTSMLPLIRQGTDYVELSPLPEKLKKYDLPLYQRPDGTFVLHRIIKAGTTYTCMGDNQFRKETGVTYDQMIALVTAIYRGEKRVSVTAFSYKAYCRLWHWTRFFRRVWHKLARIFRK
jgi:hypothetical protein